MHDRSRRPASRRTRLALVAALFGLPGGAVDAADPPPTGPTAAASPAPAAPPHIVLFLVDDMGWQETSVAFHSEVTALNRRYRTPNMERLAARGMRLTQAYACAVCSPTRVSLMTGLNAARHGVTCWTLRRDRSPEPGRGPVKPPAWNLNGLSPVPGVERTVHAISLPELLRKAGYRTIHVGKAHFGAKGTPGEMPTDQGFDVNIAGHAAGGPGSHHGVHDFSAAWRGGDRIWDVPDLEAYHGKDIHLTEALTIEALKAVDGALADGKRLYLYMSHYAIHAPWEKDDRFYARYVEAGLSPFEATYASMVESMDKSLGDILSHLERRGIDRDTLVLFLSDNGSPKQAPRNLPLRGHKLTPYEGGVRVPMIARWPGVIEPGSASAVPVMVEDIFPSLLEVAGVTGYEQVGGAIDGVSFVPILRGEVADRPDRALFWHYPNTYDQPPYSSVRQGDWKLIYHHADRRIELFDLSRDIGETKDLSGERPGTTERLARVLTEHLRATRAAMPTDRSTGRPVESPLEAWRRRSGATTPR